MSLEYDDKNHAYKIDGFPVLSVTQALDEAGVTKYWEHPTLTPYYLQRGTELDRTIELHLADNLGDPGDFGAQLDGFKKFQIDTRFSLIQSHPKLYSKKMMYAGTSDFVGLVNGDRSLVELKAETYCYWYELQTAAYFNAHNEMFPREKLKRRFVLNLSKDGKYKLTENRNPTDISTFYGCLLVGNYKKTKGANYNGSSSANT